MISLSCEQCRAHLPEYVAHQLGLPERQAIAHHLRTCDSCRRELHEWQDLARAVTNLHSTIEPPFASQSQVWNSLSRRIVRAAGPAPSMDALWAAQARAQQRRALGIIKGGKRIVEQQPSTQPPAAPTPAAISPPMPEKTAPHLQRRLMGAVAVVLTIMVVVVLVGVIHAHQSAGTSAGVYPLPARSSSGATYTYQTPTKIGGTVVVGSLQAVTAPNPFADITVADGNAVPALWDACVLQLPDLSLGMSGFKPDQCASLPTESADGMTTTLHIQSGLKWSDGQPLTANDFAFGANFFADPTIAGEFPFDTLQNAQVVDQLTLILHWSKPSPAYLFTASLLYPLPIHVFPSAYDTTSGAYDSQAMQGLLASPQFTTLLTASNGAFKVQSLATTATFVRNPLFKSNFFRPTALDKLVFTTAPDAQTLITGFKSGRYDLVEGLDENSLASFSGIPTDEQLITPRSQVEMFQFNQRSAAPNALMNNNVSIFAGAKGQMVRQAFIEAFDKCPAVQAILHKNCTDPEVAATANTYPSTLSAGQTVPAYNPSDARALLDRAGYTLKNGKRVDASGNPLSITLVTYAYQQNRATMAQAAQAAWVSNLGINVVIKYDDNPYKEALDSGTFDIVLISYLSGGDQAATYDNYLSSQIPSKAVPFGPNISGVQNAQLDTAINGAAHEMNILQRQQDYAALQQYIISNDLVFPLYLRQNISLAQATLGNYFHSPTASYNEWNIPDWFTTK